MIIESPDMIFVFKSTLSKISKVTHVDTMVLVEELHVLIFTVKLYVQWCSHVRLNHVLFIPHVHQVILVVHQSILFKLYS